MRIPRCFTLLSILWSAEQKTIRFTIRRTRLHDSSVRLNEARSKLQQRFKNRNKQTPYKLQKCVPILLLLLINYSIDGYKVVWDVAARETETNSECFYVYVCVCVHGLYENRRKKYGTIETFLFLASFDLKFKRNIEIKKKQRRRIWRDSNI